MDTSAWIEFFVGGNRGRKVGGHLLAADLNATPTVVLAELQKKYVQNGRRQDEFESDVGRIRTLSVVTSEIPELVASAAGKIAALQKHSNMSLVDCLLLALARNYRGGKVLSCDGQFKGYKEAIYVGGTR